MGILRAIVEPTTNLLAISNADLSDNRFQNVAFMIDGAPEIAELAVDLYKDLVQMPPPLRIGAR